jgi:hypothetical protein
MTGQKKRKEKNGVGIVKRPTLGGVKNTGFGLNNWSRVLTKDCGEALLVDVHICFSGLDNR